MTIARGRHSGHARRAPAPRIPEHPATEGLSPFRLATGFALLAGVAGAWKRAWSSDDAFISFRYAANLAHGLGLVFNRGERVEGYSNFLWTIWTALGIRLGVNPEVWSLASSLTCYGGAILLLAWMARRVAPPTARANVVPVAALLAAFHPAWSYFATSGLETSLFTLLVVVALSVTTARARWSPAAAGLACALLALTRPDGPVFAPAIAIGLLATQRQKVRALLEFVGAFAVLWGPYTWWRVGYYHAFFPNTYYAKSAFLPWWRQGVAYLALYAMKYWALLLGIPLWVIAVALRRGVGDRVAIGAVGLAMGGTYAFYVARVGGDFMFARFLVPVTPLLLVTLEAGLQALLGASPLRIAAATAAIALAGMLTPDPIPGDGLRHGISNEWADYTPERAAPMRARGEMLRPYLQGLPARLAFMGGEARAIFYSDVEIAIESAAGLTDSTTAHQPLLHRGRVGHEKHPTPEYLLGTRRTNLAMSPTDARTLGLDRDVPLVPVAMGSIALTLLRWDPVLVDSLRRRGARIPDLPGSIDAAVAQLDALPDTTVAAMYRKLKLSYFDPAGDRAREQAFLRRLGRAPAPARP